MAPVCFDRGHMKAVLFCNHGGFDVGFRYRSRFKVLEQINFENIHSQSLRHAHFGV